MSGIASDLAVSPSALDFAAVPIADTRTFAVTLANGSRAALTLHLSAPAPFALEQTLRLGGGETREVLVSFTPDALGAQQATLTIDGDLTAAVALSGEGVAAASCTAPSPCRTSQRDPATNTCVEALQPDGTACTSADACLANGVCRAGTCVGITTSCDDFDRCTVDACEPVGGCLHFEATCAQAENPCQVARCDPAQGCVTAPAADGTQCGPSDCTSAHVCLAGTCQTRSVPEGYACGDTSPCQASGHCAQGACVRPAVTALTEAWHRQLPDGADWRGVTDPSGNLYWFECDPTPDLPPCSLMSVTPTGIERFRAAVSALDSSVGSRHLWAQGRVVVAGPRGELSVHSDATGAVLWSRGSGGLGDQLIEMVADQHGQLLQTMLIGDKAEAYALRTLDAATGATLRTRALVAPVHGLVLDAQDNVYLLSGLPPPTTGRGTGGPPTPTGAGATLFLTSLSPGGATRFQVPLSTLAWPVAAHNGELLLDTGDVRSTVDGAQRSSFNPNLSDIDRGPSPLMATASRYWWRPTGCCELGCNGPSSLSLEGVGAGQASPTFILPIPGGCSAQAVSVGEPVLLTTGEALFSEVDVTGTTVELRAIEPSGAERFACPLGPAQPFPDETSHWSGPSTLTHGLWVVEQVDECSSCERNPPPTLRAYHVPRLADATTGWTGLRGAPGRAGAPR